MRLLKIIVLFYFFQIALHHAVHAENTPIKIAIVDVQYILKNSLAMQDIHRKIESLSKSIEQDVSKKEVEFKKLEEDLIKKKNSLIEQEFEKQVANFNKKVTNTQQDIQSKKIGLEQAHNTSVQKVHDTIMSIINDLAQKYNLNLVLPSSQVLYASTELNITNEVLEKLNEKIKQVEVRF